ncbi:glycosyl hydrolase family 16 [Rhizobium leguminosarum bv. trifolii WSM597]|uniref:Glycosyl hydrolase family 16 n=1 Tax=Rhizobium leguminosarum bv. trifolii WSM597 TaxID=754764 RepID=I9X2E3_RHILT|nr:family 16 glycosylhydrolase [Rhizobium leguminosarum]EJB02871.1 glycosyl hydrolase family 16 [Rhizobium leguminosarum bv. trifolii WSM597]
MAMTNRKMRAMLASAKGAARAASTIGGIAVGAVGAVGSIYEGYTLNDGDEFAALDLVGPAAPRGKYFPTRTYGAGARGSDGALGTMFDTDPLFTGHMDSNRGVPAGFSNMSLSASVLTLQSRKATSGEQAHMALASGVVRNEVSAMISGAGAMYWYPGVAGTEDVIFEARVRMSSGAPAGWHPTVWVQSLTPVQPIESDEFDHEGTSLGAKFNKNLWTGGSTTASSSGTRFDHDGQWHTISFIFNKTNARRYIDGVLNGTLNGGNDKDKPQYPIISSHIFNPTFDGDTYSQSAWNADADGAQIDVDWIRVWSRTGKQSFAPIISVNDVNVDYGSSVTFTLPSALAIWGDASVSEYLQVVYNEENEPGVSHAAIYSQFPAGVSYNSGTREVTVNITSGRTGRLNFVLAGWKAGCAGRPLRFAVNVGPVPVVPELGVAGESVNIDLYALQDCGVLVTNGASKTKTIAVTGLTGSGLSYNDATGRITGTAVAGTYTVQVTVTNSVGQSKSASASKTIAATFNPATESKIVEWWDANDNATVFSDAAATTQAVAGSSSVQAFIGKKLGAALANSVGAQTPEYLTDANGKKSIKFVTANNDYLFTTNSTVVSEMTGDDNPFTIIAAVKRGTPSVSGTPWSCSPDAGTINNYIRGSFGGTNNVGFGRNVNNTLVQNQSADGLVTADHWYTVAWIFEGQTVTIRVEGVVVLNQGSLNGPAMTINRMSLGGRYDDSTNAYTAAVAFGGAYGEVFLMDGTVTSADSKVGVAEAYLMAKWTN